MNIYEITTVFGDLLELLFTFCASIWWPGDDGDGKIIFPSTHVIYEGIEFARKNITEKDKPLPVLAYSTSKVGNEE